MARLLANALTLVCCLTLAHGAVIEPKLDHRTSKEFLKDLPRDTRAVADERYKFGHPYPAVQDSDDFNADYVQDQNQDGGKWADQMTYDILRQKVRQAEKELEELKQKLAKESGEAAQAGKQWQEALQKVLDAKAATIAAEKAEVAANEKVKQITTEGKAAGYKVEDALRDLEAAKKKLADEKQSLKDLLEQQEAAKDKFEEKQAGAAAKKAAEKKAKEEKRAANEKAEAAKTAAEAEKTAAEEGKEKQRKEQAEKTEEEKKAAEEAADKEEELKQKEEAKKRQAVIDKKTAELQDAVADMAKDKAKWTKKISEEKSEYTQAASDYEAKLVAVKETEAAFAKATEVLKRYRRAPHVDQDGGVYNVPEKGNDQSFAAAWSLNAWVMAALMAAAAC